MKADARAAIRQKALELGFDAVGFAPAEQHGAARAALYDFLAAGKHGDMGWLAANADRRADPKILWPEARTAIVLGLSYAPDKDPMRNLENPELGVISVYAQGKDYHDVIKKKQRALAHWLVSEHKAGVKIFVDTAPVMEKPLAQRAGLGWQGKHTNLVSRTHGSWLFLGVVMTSLALTPDAEGEDHCGNCTRCLDICPTAAFDAPYRLDARKCISYLTIEHKGPIPREYRRQMGNRIYGCDDCLAVCPWNKFATPHAVPEFAARENLSAPRLLELVRLQDAEFRRLFAGSPIKRIGRARFVRNVLIALGNAGQTVAQDQTAVTHVTALLRDESPLVRGAAIWCLQQWLTPQEASELRAAHLPKETEASVREEWT